MTTEEKRRLLSEHLAEIRKWTYDALAAEIDRTRNRHECLRHTEGVFDDGTVYQIEIDVFWDDKRKGCVRVCADISTQPQRRLLGILPVYIPDCTDSFLVSTDGAFVGELT